TSDAVSSLVCHMSSVLCPLSSVLCPLSSVLCHLSSVICHLSSVICHLSSVICHLSSVICHLSSVICHLSSVICHLSSVICHLSSDQIMRILLNLVAEMAGKQPRLHFEQAAHRHPIAEDRMGDFLVEAALVRGDEGALGVRLEVHRRAGGDETAGRHLAVVDRL